MRLLAGGVLLLALAGCTSGGEEKAPVDHAFTDGPAATPAPDAAVPPPTTRPLAFLVNARRPPLALTERQARRLERGDVTNWRQLGQPAGPPPSTGSTHCATRRRTRSRCRGRRPRRSPP